MTPIEQIAAERDAEISMACLRAEERYWRRRSVIEPTEAHRKIVAEYDRQSTAALGYEYEVR